MSLLQVNSGIRNLLEREVVIDEWGVPAPTNLPKIVSVNGTPTYFPSTSAILNPMTNVYMGRDGHTNISTEATFSANVAWRFNASAAYRELPIKEVENLLEWVCVNAVRNPADIHPNVKNCTIGELDDPVVVSRLESDDNDWLIYATFQLDLAYNTDPIDPNDLGVIQPPILRPTGNVLSTIRLRTFAEKDTDNVDYEVDITED